MPVTEKLITVALSLASDIVTVSCPSFPGSEAEASFAVMLTVAVSSSAIVTVSVWFAPSIEIPLSPTTESIVIVTCSSSSSSDWSITVTSTVVVTWPASNVTLDGSPT